VQQKSATTPTVRFECKNRYPFFRRRHIDNHPSARRLFLGRSELLGNFVGKQSDVKKRQKVAYLLLSNVKTRKLTAAQEYTRQYQPQSIQSPQRNAMSLLKPH
jgi:hypothetical protein